MGDFPYLNWLYRKYKLKAEESKHWTDYLKAHGLANACLVRDNTEEWRRQVYDVEDSWYNGKHPQTFEEHQSMIQTHKQILQDYRKETGHAFGSLEDKHKSLNLFCCSANDHRKNEKIMESFTHRVFAMSEKCTDDFILLAGQVLQSSVLVLSQAGLVAPCPFAVIGFGSVARGEATPYSDLEYGILIESETDPEGADYFEKLSVDSYFRIGNFGETPLKCFNISELNDKDEEGNIIYVDTLPTVGFKIDGISSIAGNIPTGNGLEGSPKLIGTVERMVVLYKSKLEAPPGLISGDLSDLFSTSVLLFSSRGGELLLAEYSKTITKHEQESFGSIPAVRYKRMQTLANDVKKYNFLEHINGLSADILMKKLKTDIFRYPTLLATNLRLCFTLTTRYPWDTFSKLKELSLCTTPNLNMMHFVLAAALYIRTTAYLAYNSQKEELSFFASTKASSETELYYVPQKLFVIMNCFLVPIKRRLSKAVDQLPNTKSQMSFEEIINSVFTQTINTDDFLLKAEILSFMQAHKEALEALTSALGKEAVCNHSEFVKVITKRYGRDQSFTVEHAVSVCANILWSSSLYGEAIDYYRSLPSNPIAMALKWAEALVQLHSFQQAVPLLLKIRISIHTALRIELTNEAAIYNLAELQPKDTSTAALFLLLKIAVSQLSFCLIHVPGRLEDSLEFNTVAISILEGLLEKGYADRNTYELQSANYLRVKAEIYTKQHQYHEALKLYQIVIEKYIHIYGKGTQHEDIICAFVSVSTLHHELNNFPESLRYGLKAKNMLITIHGEESNHHLLASAYCNIGLYYDDMGKYDEALEALTIALNKRLCLYGSTAKHPMIACSYSELGNLYCHNSKDEESLENHQKALSMRLAVYGQHSDHEEIAASLSNIGTLHNSTKRYPEALQCHHKALQMVLSIYKNEPNSQIFRTYISLAIVYRDTEDYPTAITYCTEALRVAKEMYSEQAENHPDLLHCYNVLAHLQGWVGDYYKSAGYHNEALKIELSTHVESSVLARRYYTIGRANYMLRHYSGALQNYLSADEYMVND